MPRIECWDCRAPTPFLDNRFLTLSIAFLQSAPISSCDGYLRRNWSHFHSRDVKETRWSFCWLFCSYRRSSWSSCHSRFFLCESMNYPARRKPMNGNLELQRKVCLHFAGIWRAPEIWGEVIRFVAPIERKVCNINYEVWRNFWEKWTRKFQSNAVDLEWLLDPFIIRGYKVG